MIKGITLWKLPNGVTEKDFESWYEDKHVPEVRKVPGLLRYETGRIMPERAAPDSYYRMAEFTFESLEAMDAAMKSPQWAAAVADAGTWIASPARYFFETTVRIPDERA
jgi:uncharacterized protein (TIGR02118 family)